MNQPYENDEIEIDLKELFYLLKNRILVILAAGFLCAAVAAVACLYIITPTYQATSKLYILTQSTSITSLADIQLGSSLATDYLELIKSRPVVEKVIQNLDLDQEYGELVNQLTIENPADTRILNITITDSDPKSAQEISNEFAKVAMNQISKIMKTDEPSKVEDAVLPESPVGPRTKKDVAVGFLVGLFLSAGVIVVIYLMDDTLKTQEDVEKYLGLNTLGMIPLREDEKKTKKKRTSQRRKG